MCHSSLKTLKLIKCFYLKPDQKLPDALGTYLPCLSLHSDHYFLPIASLCQTPALSMWGFGGAPLLYCWTTGRSLLPSWSCQKAVNQKKCWNLVCDYLISGLHGCFYSNETWKSMIWGSRPHTQVHSAQVDNQQARQGAGGETFTIPFFAGRSFFLSFFFNPWDTCGRIFGQPSNLFFTSPIPDAEKAWEREEKGTTEDEMVGWHRQLNGHEF